MRHASAHDHSLHNTLRVGIICPYSFETPGGVQNHIRDFAQNLIDRGYEVAVYAPGRRTAGMPLWVHTNDSSFAVPYNGSWAHLSFFLTAGLRTRRWVKQGHFDVLHVHEPEAPSLSHKPLFMHDAPPMVATFHASIEPYPRLLKIFEKFLQRDLSGLSQAIFVSPAAQKTAQHFLPDSIDCHIIPNGIDWDFFASAQPNPQWQGTADAPTIGFLGRMSEERKGFAVFARAATMVLEEYPQARFLCAGDGQDHAERILQGLDPSGELPRHFEFLGRIDDDQKASFYQSLSLYTAPQIGGESFGIVLAEAMAAQCTVVASDLEAFKDVTENGKDAALFSTGDARHCAETITQLLGDNQRRQDLARLGAQRSQVFDWSAVVDEVVEVYRQALS